MGYDTRHTRLMCTLASCTLVLLVLFVSIAYGAAPLTAGAADLAALESLAAEEAVDSLQLANNSLHVEDMSLWAQEGEPVSILRHAPDDSSNYSTRNLTRWPWRGYLRTVFASILGGTSGYMHAFVEGRRTYISIEQKRRALKEVTIPHIIHQVTFGCNCSIPSARAYHRGSRSG